MKPKIAVAWTTEDELRFIARLGQHLPDNPHVRVVSSTRPLLVSLYARAIRQRVNWAGMDARAVRAAAARACA